MKIEAHTHAHTRRKLRCLFLASIGNESKLFMMERSERIAMPHGTAQFLENLTVKQSSRQSINHAADN
jgi:hypothetical protein